MTNIEKLAEYILSSSHSDKIIELIENGTSSISNNNIMCSLNDELINKHRKVEIIS